MAARASLKPLRWVGDTYEAMCGFPQAVRQEMGYALYLAQAGDRHPDAKPLKGFGGAGVLEVVGIHQGDTFRAVYTVKLADAVYVLHAFKKKAKKGIATPRQEIDLIRQRLKAAREHHERTHGGSA